MRDSPSLGQPRKKRGKINVGTTTRREIAVGVGTACDGRGRERAIAQRNKPGRQEGAHDQEKCLLGTRGIIRQNGVALVEEGK